MDIVSGTSFPQELAGYDLIVHCGGCMFRDSERALKGDSIQDTVELGEENAVVGDGDSLCLGAVDPGEQILPAEHTAAAVHV